MLKNRKIEVRFVKDAKRSNTPETPEGPTLDARDYALIAEEAATRLGKKLIIGVVAVIVTTAVIAVLANAADTALQNAINE